MRCGCAWTSAWTAGAVLAVVLAFSSIANAFVRQRVDTAADAPELWWRYRTIRMRPAYATLHDVPPESTRMAVLRSMDAWNAAAGPCSDLLFEEGEPATGLDTNLTRGEIRIDDAENRIVWREEPDWPEEAGTQTLALTTLIFRRTSGEILDADMDLNAEHQYWTVTDVPGMVATDVQNTVTHELGHVFGLGHSPDPDATMFFESAQGDLEKRTLAQDDIDGLCFMYPAGRGTPGAPLLSQPGLTSGCAVGSRGAHAPVFLLMSIVLLARRVGRRAVLR
ncbi:MAG: matrixin family metalloprotease [Sandaracinaceae bacterium]|nr:matrixin family metalloprotease [Sandaracinaceae bacterium]